MVVIWRERRRLRAGGGDLSSFLSLSPGILHCKALHFGQAGVISRYKPGVDFQNTAFLSIEGNDPLYQNGMRYYFLHREYVPASCSNQ